MADNVDPKVATNVPVATDVVTYSGDANQNVQLVRVVEVTGSEGSKTVISKYSKISTSNSSDTELTNGAAFTGTGEDVSDFAAIEIFVYASHASATDGLQFQFSIDNSNWRTTDQYTVSATNPKSFSVQPAARYFRIVYTNGGTTQTTFELQTILHYSLVKGSSQRPGDARSNEIDVEEVAAYLNYFNGTTWDRARGDATYGFDVDVNRVAPATGSGSITANGQAVTLTLNGESAGAVQVTGTWVGTLQFEGTVDGSNWVAINSVVAGSSTIATTTTANGVFRLTPAGLASFRVTSTAWTSGTATITIRAGLGAGGTFANQILPTQGDVAHDAADSGNPVKVGGVAVSGSATPTSVAAADRVRFIANQHGMQYVIAGHPNLITREYDFGTAAQTDVNLAAAAVAADERIYVTRFEAMCDNANTVNVSVRCGFGTANVPAASATGVSGMIGSHPGIAPGSGFASGNGSGIIAVGAAGEEPRLTSSAATTGNLHVVISYYLIDETP